MVKAMRGFQICDDGRRGHIIVDTISNMNGLERLFAIVVDMDKPLEGQKGVRRI